MIVMMAPCWLVLAVRLPKLLVSDDGVITRRQPSVGARGSPRTVECSTPPSPTGVRV